MILWITQSKLHLIDEEREVSSAVKATQSLSNTTVGTLFPQYKTTS